MSEIEFETDSIVGDMNRRKTSAEEVPFFVKWLMQLGVRDSTTANYILIGATAFFIGAAIYLYAGIFEEPQKDWSLDAKASTEAQKYQH
ncbi:MAG: hypothetical protein AAB628_00125 [Patescibacteria group bacterium]